MRKKPPQGMAYEFSEQLGIYLTEPLGDPRFVAARLHNLNTLIFERIVRETKIKLWDRMVVIVKHKIINYVPIRPLEALKWDDSWARRRRPQ